MLKDWNTCPFCGNGMTHELGVIIPESGARVCGNCWRSRRGYTWFMDQVNEVIELTDTEVKVLQQVGYVFTEATWGGHHRRVNRDPIQFDYTKYWNEV